MHREALTRPTADLIGRLKPFDGFYLGGGTALALQLGHRVSVNFDLFSDDDIPTSLLKHVQQVFDMPVSPLVNDSDELTVVVHGVKITFLRYPFPVLEPFVAYNGIRLLSVSEIAATKAYTIVRRGSYKDYVDLYFAIEEGHTTLAAIIEDAEKKYAAEFNSRLFLEQLLYLDDLEDIEIQFLKPLVTLRELRAFFEAQIRDYPSGAGQRRLPIEEPRPISSRNVLRDGAQARAMRDREIAAELSDLNDPSSTRVAFPAADKRLVSRYDGRMDKRFAFIIAVLIDRLRDFPKEAWDELFAALDAIDRKYDLVPPLSDADREKIEEGMRSLDDGKGIPMEEIELFKRLEDFDHNAAGRDDFIDVVSRVNRLSGEEQGSVADVIFALLHEYRYDIPPPLPEIRL